MIKTDNIFITGGAGTLGRAIARKRQREGWTGKMTVYSTDAAKHNALKRDYPDIHFIQGDIRNGETLRLAMAGHDLVIHAAAVKFIPDSEIASIDTIDVNVYGSQVICDAARAAGVHTVLGISTDKACHPANAYGSTKHLMEKIFQEQARYGGETQFKLVRYGNVLESRGSVIEAWKKAIDAGLPPKITNPEMTRFWLSPSQAADYVEQSLGVDNGMIYIPKMPALSIQKLAEYAIGLQNWAPETIPMRPGEKLHETLLTVEETDYCLLVDDSYYVLMPTYRMRSGNPNGYTAYTSQNARELTREELEILLSDD